MRSSTSDPRRLGPADICLSSRGYWRGGEMFTFNVVRKQHGWAVQMGERMTMPFRSRDLAVREANRLADAIRGHGECAEVIVEAPDQAEPRPTYERSPSLALTVLVGGRWPGVQ
jgi:hypothetical protein